MSVKSISDKEFSQRLVALIQMRGKPVDLAGLKAFFMNDASTRAQKNPGSKRISPPIHHKTVVVKDEMISQTTMLVVGGVVVAAIFIYNS